MIYRLIARRLVALVPVLLGVTLITFFLSHVVPSDSARLYAGPRASPEALANVRHQFGLDKPLATQFVNFVGNLLHGDFGPSLSSHRAVSADLADFLPATIELTLMAIAFILVIGVPLGVVSAAWEGSIFDHLGRVVSITGSAIPPFWLGLMAQFFFFDQLGWFPAGGRLDQNTAPPPHITGLYTVDSILTGHLGLLVQSIWYLLLPAIVLGYGSLAVITRMVRASMLESLGQDYVRTARAKGLRRRRVVVQHALRNALLPTITVMGLQVGALLSGALLIEEVFSWPGIGRYGTDATLAIDYNAIMAITLIAALIYVLVNLLVDILYLVVDPRVAY